MESGAVPDRLPAYGSTMAPVLANLDAAGRNALLHENAHSLYA